MRANEGVEHRDSPPCCDIIESGICCAVPEAHLADIAVDMVIVVHRHDAHRFIGAFDWRDGFTASCTFRRVGPGMSTLFFTVSLHPRLLALTRRVIVQRYGSIPSAKNENKLGENRSLLLMRPVRRLSSCSPASGRSMHRDRCLSSHIEQRSFRKQNHPSLLMEVSDAVDLIIHVYREGHSVETFVTHAASEATWMVGFTHSLENLKCIVICQRQGLPAHNIDINNNNTTIHDESNLKTRQVLRSYPCPNIRKFSSSKSLPGSPFP